MILGLDWDDTITEYTTGFKKLVEIATEIHIITLNKDVTHGYASDLLNFYNHLNIHVMPDKVINTDLPDFGIADWKAQKCVENKVDLMFDDLKEVVDMCLKLGIPAIQVEARWKEIND